MPFAFEKLMITNVRKTNRLIVYSPKIQVVQSVFKALAIWF